jgi:hypothetical protein
MVYSKNISVETLYKQTLYTYNDLLFSKHAYNRIANRGIRLDEILCSWKSQDTLCRNTRDNRMEFSNLEYGLIIVIEKDTRIIVTVIEMEWRKYRFGRHNLQKKYGLKGSILPVPLLVN